VDHSDYLQENAGLGVLAYWGIIALMDRARMVKNPHGIVEKCRPLWYPKLGECWAYPSLLRRRALGQEAGG